MKWLLHLSKALFDVKLSAEDNTFPEIYEYSRNIKEGLRPAAKWLK